MLTGRTTSTTVATMMTASPIVISEHESIAGVAELLAGFEISGMPVVDQGDHLVGVISETDLVRLEGAAIPWTGWHGVLVRDLMTYPAQTIVGTATLDDAARLMTALGIHRLVVVDDDQIPIGIITQSDLVREIADACDDC
jgi:CBS domain-containing protein